MEPFFKSDKKKKRLDLDTECQCFEAYEKDKDDKNVTWTLYITETLRCHRAGMVACTLYKAPWDS